MSGHPAYPHPGPGPSSYYQPSPPPHHAYGNHSPGPRQNYYPYAPPPPPHMNSHQPAQYHHQPPPQSRGNHRGGGSYNSRGNHHYHNYHQQQAPYAHSHVNPPLGVHPAQHLPYSPQSPAKYNQPFSPSYPYPSPSAPVFTPSWQAQQQPISPLPKQLSMPPQNVHSGIYEPQAASPPSSQTIETPQSPAAEPAVAEGSSEGAKSEPLSPSLSSSSSSLPPAPSSEPAPQPQATSYSQMGTISTTSNSNPPPSPSNTSTPPRKTVVNPTAKWAIWSRRPQDPSHAPSIIISPRARPPPDVIQQAIDLKTPPRSLTSSPIATKTVPQFTSGDGASPEPGETETSTKDAPTSPLPSNSSDEIAGVAWSSQTNSTVPSSSVTESTDTPTIPGSPASSHTSLSVAGTPSKEGKDTVVAQTEKETKDVADSVAASTKVVEKPAAAADEKAAEAALPDAAIVAVEATSTPGAGVLTPIPDTDTATSPVVAAPQPTAATPAVAAPTASSPSAPPIKKSWASLLRPASSPATSATGVPVRNALPTSSVVGFSIPAASATPTVPVSPSKKSDLINLLTAGPVPALTFGSGFAAAAAAGTGAAGTSTMMKIRPRGLINSGNMCFANSVLQILVYCPPFHRLFVELGKVLVGPVVGTGSSGSGSGPANGAANVNGVVNGTAKPESATPLVEATIEFLKEFLEEKNKKGKSKERPKLEVVGRGGSSGANGSNGFARAKGKEREREADEEEDDWDGESFLPTYVYDAMKAKKRFDNMRGGHQEDAEEFFGFYLDTLEEELLSILHSVNPTRPTKGSSGPAPVEEKEEAAPPEDDGWLEVGKRNRMVITRTIKATESPITRIFGGKFRSTLRAPGQKDSVVVEDWRSLRLDIQREQIHTIQDALSYISHPQPVQVTQAAKPGITIEAQQQVLIEALPPILVLHIKRFCYDTSVGGVVKVGKQVRFGPELEIGSDIMVPAAKKAHPAKYKLFGAVYHHGLSASGGHYTLDVLHPSRYPPANPTAKPREGWVRIDDNLVSDVRPDDVFEAYERDEARCAYLLFYRRI